MKNCAIALFALLLVTQVPIGCSTGFRYDAGEYEIVGIDVSAGQHSEDWHTLHEWDFTSPDTLIDTMLGIIISGEQKFVEEEPNQHFQNPFITTAMADPAPPTPTEGMGIALISIYAEESVFADGKEFKAGETLSSLFSVNVYGSVVSTLPKYTQTSNSWTGEYEASIRLQFTGDLDKPLAQPLTIKVTLENEDELEDTTRKIVIKP